MSRLLFRLAFLLASAVLFHAAGPARGQEVLDGIAAVVNNDVVTFSQVRELVASKERAAKEILKGEELVAKIKEIRLAAINDLIDRQLILQEFKSKGFQIPDYFIEERVTTIVREEFGNDRSAFIRTLAAQGFTLEKFREMEKDKIIVQEMRRQAIKGTPSVSDEQVAAYYKTHAEDFGTAEQLKLRTITIRRNPHNDSKRKQIEEIREKIMSGAEFGDLARMYSEDDKQEVYGDWGWIDKRTLNENLSKSAFALKAGEVSRVIELAGSYYLLYAEAKKPPVIKPLKEVKAEIEKGMLQIERQKQQTEWLAKLRKKAFIKMY
ncbi:MAG: peptidyl-prolyl cis-trans isomerase [Chthoniobacter sp.]|nr:peptidyl-prolyl cis-trans isomerase [Chthoniobacter sp.]